MSILGRNSTILPDQGFHAVFDPINRDQRCDCWCRITININFGKDLCYGFFESHCSIKKSSSSTVLNFNAIKHVSVKKIDKYKFDK